MLPITVLYVTFCRISEDSILWGSFNASSTSARMIALWRVMQTVHRETSRWGAGEGRLSVTFPFPPAGVGSLLPLIEGCGPGNRLPSVSVPGRRFEEKRCPSPARRGRVGVGVRVEVT